jgi:hypothetical protein
MPKKIDVDILSINVTEDHGVQTATIVIVYEGPENLEEEIQAEERLSIELPSKPQP